jgi:outer membrane protein
MKIASLVICLVASVSAFAQTTPVVQKLGYADTDYILMQLPDSKKIETDLQAHGSQLEATLKSKVADYENKLKAYQQGAATMIDAIRQDKEAELTQLQQGIEKFRQDAETSFARKNQDLMKPVVDKIGKAIEAVAKEQGYTFIISMQAPGGNDILLHSDEKFDISNDVLKKLGVTAPAAAKPPGQ